MKRVWFLCVLAIAVAAAAVILWRTLSPRQVSVLLVTMDATRADRLGCYGCAEAVTPALDRLAKESLRFTRAHTHVPLTLPSHATILTGLYPPEHGLRDNMHSRLGKDTPTLATILKARDYRTAAFVASYVLDRQFGLARGFDVYDDRMEPPAKGDSVYQRENRADVVCDRALAWLRRNAGQPFFCWVHFYDPHEPYDPPPPFKARFRAPYDGEIAFMDSQIARLMAFVEQRGLDKRTLIVVCADHGEAFGEHDEFEHGMLNYETTMRVPLMVRLPGRGRSGTVDRSVGLVDIVPTICSVLGGKTAGGSGHSLLQASVEEYYGESLYPWYTYRWAPLYSLTTARWKYVAAPQPELYDLTSDALEQRNLAVDQSAIASLMKAGLDRLRSGMKAGQAGKTALDHAALAKLRSLGYSAGSEAPPPDDIRAGNLKDPKAMMTLVHQPCATARQMMSDGEYRKAISLLESVASKSPESPDVHELLSGSYLKLGEHQKALPHLQALVETDPKNRVALFNLGSAALAAGNNDVAIRVYNEVLALARDTREPFTPSGVSTITIKARLWLSVALKKVNRLDEAAAQYLLVLGDQPDNLDAITCLGDLYMLQGKKALAIEHYRKSLAAVPRLTSARENLGCLLCEQRQYDEALKVWRKGLELQPGEPVFLFYLAWWLSTCPETTCRNGREAVTLAEALGNKSGWTIAQGLDCAAAACAEAGDFLKAVAYAEKGLAMAKATPEGAALAKEMETRLGLYREKKPYRQFK